MSTVGCLQCLQWYDPSRGPHICGLVGDETARQLAERLDAFERRFQGLELEERSRFNALERRVHELEAAQAKRDRGRAEEDAPSRVRILLPPVPAPAPEPTKHAVYMRAWRRKRAALRSPAGTPLQG
jgi:hypothetical protein